MYEKGKSMFKERKISIYLSIYLSILIIFSLFVGYGELLIGRDLDYGQHYHQVTNNNLDELEREEYNIDFATHSVINYKPAPSIRVELGTVLGRYIGPFEKGGIALDHSFLGYFSGDQNGLGKLYFVIPNVLMGQNNSALWENSEKMLGVSKWDISQDMTLYPFYTSVNTDAEIGIVLNPNFGETDRSVENNIAIISKGQPMPSGKKAPTRAGYIFDGYYSNIDVETYEAYGDMYYDADMNSVRSAVAYGDMPRALHAKWIRQEHVYTVTLDKNGGIGGTSEVVVMLGDYMPTAVVAPSREGYVFKGYYDRVEDGNKYYDEDMNPVSKWDKEEDCTLYAKWEEVYTISFAKVSENGLQIPSVQATFGELVPPINYIYRPSSGYYGLYTEKDGNGLLYYGSDRDGEKYKFIRAKVFDEHHDITLYPFVSARPIRPIMLNPNGGSLGGTTVEDNIAWADWNLPLNSGRKIPTREGYKFAGFYDSIGEWNDEDKSYEVLGTQWYDENMECRVSPEDINLDWIPRIIHAKWIAIHNPPIDPNSPTEVGVDSNLMTIIGWSVGGVFVVAVVLTVTIIMIKRNKNRVAYSSGNRKSRNNTLTNNSYSSQNNNNSLYNNKYNNQQNDDNNSCY
ncbi:MAG: InlB B-repeat-containing protein [Firmicutes bacterium]|nr:InlB B-repeat-containing protein [Bacillota bacterium]MCL1953634.1 InlB B-repeat-containing protein [Bacillota bacterium]